MYMFLQKIKMYYYLFYKNMNKTYICTYYDGLFNEYKNIELNYVY